LGARASDVSLRACPLMTNRSRQQALVRTLLDVSFRDATYTRAVASLRRKVDGFSFEMMDRKAERVGGVTAAACERIAQPASYPDVGLSRSYCDDFLENQRGKAQFHFLSTGAIARLSNLTETQQTLFPFDLLPIR
jgi:hypothetical protein